MRSPVPPVHAGRKLEPSYEKVQAHYDLSDEFFALFLDPTMTYSCAFFERDGMTLEEAQLAKIDLALRKCELRPGMRLLDIGCGWGSTLRRAAERYGVHAVGLTLSRNQHRGVSQSLRRLPACAGRAEVRLQGWEEFSEPVDAIVSIGAFEHFRAERYASFFARCRAILPAGGRMLLHAILQVDRGTLQRLGIATRHEDVLFAKFILRYIFPGGQLCPAQTVVRHAEQAGFQVTQTQSLQPHYARTLDAWAANLRAAHDRAVAVTSPEVYERYIRYLEGCAGYFRSGHLDVAQFTLCAA
jgi:cyclopropane-fatty-acyl-phospholipid synthase